ncbi:MAG: helix-turn-helix domain-containing protein [Treponema sp.]|jgi:transcriptional regulator with XRE-family HTH domain|nr:helix-turn-helix domain-containing protein [Treponema sp.]
MGFNEYLKGELEYKGILVKELANVTGIPKQTLDKYLLAHGSMPPADKAVAIAQALGISVEYLVTGKHPKKEQGTKYSLSPEMRAITEQVEPLNREERKIIEHAVIELVRLLRHPGRTPASLTLLQKVFVQLFR